MSKAYFSSPLVSNKLIVSNGGSIEIELDGHKVSLQTSEGLANDVILTLPLNTGTVGQVLRTDGNGVLSWVNNVSAAGGTDMQIQFNNNGDLDGLPNLLYADGNFLLGDDDGDTKLYFRSITGKTYINSVNEGQLTVSGGNSVTIASRDDDEETGQITLETRGMLYEYPDQGYEMETAGNIYYWTGNGYELESNATSNNSIKFNAYGGAINFNALRIIEKVERIRIGITEAISAISPSGSIVNPESSIVCLHSSATENSNTFYWDLRSLGVNGHRLSIFYDKGSNPYDVYVRVEFGEDGLVSGAGNVSALIFKTHGESAQLICMPTDDYNGVDQGRRQWYIINTGAQII